MRFRVPFPYLTFPVLVLGVAYWLSGLGVVSTLPPEYFKAGIIIASDEALRNLWDWDIQNAAHQHFACDWGAATREEVARNNDVLRWSGVTGRPLDHSDPPTWLTGNVQSRWSSRRSGVPFRVLSSGNKTTIFLESEVGPDGMPPTILPTK